MKKIIVFAVFCSMAFAASAQYIRVIKADSVLITNDSCNAELNLENGTRNVKGFLYNKGNGRTEFRKGIMRIIGNDSLFVIGDDTLNLSGSGLFWKLIGNSGTNPSTNFIGTTDANPLVFKTNNIENARITTQGAFQLGNSVKFSPEASNIVRVTTIAAGDTGAGLRLRALRFVDNAAPWQTALPTIFAQQGDFLTIDAANLQLLTPMISTSQQYTTWSIGAKAPLIIKGNGNSSNPDFIDLYSQDPVDIGNNVGLSFSLNKEAATKTKIARIAASITDTTAMSPDGELEFSTLTNSALIKRLIIDSVNFVASLDTVFAYAPGTKRLVKTKINSSGAGWNLSGNAGTNPSTNFLGTTDSTKLVFKTFGQQRASIFTNGTVNIGSSDTTSRPIFRFYPNGDFAAGATNEYTYNQFEKKNGIRFNKKLGILEVGVSNNLDTTLSGLYGSYQTSGLIVNSDNLNTIEGSMISSIISGDGITLGADKSLKWSIVSGERHYLNGTINKSHINGYENLIYSNDMRSSIINGDANRIDSTSIGNMVNGFVNRDYDSSYFTLVTGAFNRFSGNAQLLAGINLISKSFGATTIGSANVDFSSLPVVKGPNKPASLNSYPVFAIGNSNDYNTIRSNALTVLYNGRTQINTTGHTTSLSESDVTPKAALEIVSANSGVLLPKLTNTQRNSIAGGDLHNGLLLYNTDSSLFQFYDGTTWKSLSDNIATSANFWSLTGNVNTNPSTNFLGTTDAQRLVFRTKNTEWATIDTLGRVGIGTSDPVEKFDLYNGKARIKGSYAINHGSAPLVVIDTASSDPNQYNLAYLGNPNLPDNSRLTFQFGKESSTNNTGFISFSKFSNGSSANYMEFQMWSVANLLKIHANRNVEIGKVGGGLITDDGYRLNVLKSETALTTEGRVINAYTQGATYNTTSSALSSYGGYFNSNGTRASGSNDLTNIGLFATASGGQVNYALKTDGAVNMTNLPTSTDTTTYKPIAINSSGDVVKVTGWPPVVNYTVQSLTDGSTVTWDAANGINAVVTLGGAGRTLSITNPVAGMTYTIRVIQDGTGSRTITTWPTNSKWPSGVAPTLSTVAGRYDIVVFYYDGTNYYGTYQQNFQ